MAARAAGAHLPGDDAQQRGLRPDRGHRAQRRNFFAANLRAFLGDGGLWIWLIHRVFFPTFEPIVDFVHVLTHVYLAAKVLGGGADAVWERYLCWATACWQGRVAEVLEKLRQAHSGMTPPVEDREEKPADPYHVISKTIVLSWCAGRGSGRRFSGRGRPRPPGLAPTARGTIVLRAQPAPDGLPPLSPTGFAGELGSGGIADQAIQSAGQRDREILERGPGRDDSPIAGGAVVGRWPFIRAPQEANDQPLPAVQNYEAQESWVAGQEYVPLPTRCCSWGFSTASVRLLVLGDGAAWIRTWFESLGISLKAMILWWWHLRKRCSEQMSSAGGPKDLRRAFEKELLGQLWEGKVNAAIELLKRALEWVRNPAAVEELIAYLKKRRAYIPDYQQRQLAGLWIASTRVEKYNDWAVSARCKHQGMSWSPQGVLALAALEAARRNGELDGWRRDRAAPGVCVTRTGSQGRLIAEPAHQRAARGNFPGARQLVAMRGRMCKIGGGGFRRDSGPGWRLSLPDR